jgi:ribonucleoside-diphosphate reductase alpha subunit
MFQKLEPMFVIKRGGKKEIVYFDKITNRLKKLMYDIDNIDPVLITQKLCSRIVSGITTTELDNLASQICMSMLTDNPNYGILGARIAISNHQKNTDDNFLSVLDNLINNKDVHNELSPMINQEIFSLASKYEKEINKMIEYDRDYLIDFFGFKTLEKSYLLRINKKSVERPQHLFMRVALAIHGDDLINVKKTYDNLSLKNYTHATPTLFNAGCPNQQLSSCYLIATEDSVEGIFGTMTDCAKISKWSGGIGLHISNIRANGSYIRKTAGYSDGIMPMLKVYNDIARYINQCFTPETIVYTTSGPKEISNILEGDEVITIDGTPKRVLGIKKTNIKKEILKIKTTYSADFVNVTDEHQIYVLRGQRKMLRHNVIINRLEKNIIKEEYISAKEMNTNDILCYPIPVISEYFKIDKDICRLYGIMLGDGHISKKKNSNSKEAGITMGFAKIETINFVKQLLEKYKIYYWEDIRETNCVRIGWTHTNLENTLGFCYDDLYDSNHHKKVSKRFLNMNNENTLSLIKGLIETDGSIENEIYFSSTSKNLIESLRYCLLRLGILSSGYIKNNIGNVSSYKNITTRLLSYNLRIPKDTLLCKELEIEPSKKLGYFRYKNTLYSKIKSISNFEYEGEVFDLNIEDNHNYLTQMGLVHNSGKRNGSFAVYIEPWHADIFTFLDAKKNHGSEELRARDLFYALWVPDLFMKAIEEGGDWYLMCPDKCPGLPDVYGEEFDKLYLKYVVENKYNKKIKARELWDAIISSQMETGVPYMSYKDHVNRKSNQKNIDIIRSSNLCNEINEVSNQGETAVCNLASICLPSILEYPNKSYHDWYDLLTHEEKQLSEYYFRGRLKLLSEPDCVYCKLLKALLKEVGLEYEEISSENAEELRQFCARPIPDKFTTIPQLFSIIEDGEVDEVKYLGGYTKTWSLLSPKINHNRLRDLSYDLTKNLNKIIDINYYPTEKTKVSNMRHRPIGIGVQGLADLFLALKLPFDSVEARKINKEIFETIYFGALDSSHTLAFKEGPYSTFGGSPLSEGILQFNMWGLKDEDLSGRWKWNSLRKNIMRDGVRNSLLVALMPTASTSQIMGSVVECFEPLTSNLYTRRTLAGEFVIINPYLVKDLINLDMWNDDMKNRLQYDKGSVKNIKNFPFKDIYRTVWEIPQKSLIEMSADRGVFVCQSQSLNLFFEKPEYKKLSMAHLLGWKLGLKTGSYYIRSKPATSAQRFAMDPDVEKRLKEEDLQNKEDNECLSCGA